MVDDRGALASFLETAPDAMILVRADGRIVEANRRADELFGHADGLVGHVVEELLPGSLAEAHRHHRERFLTAPEPRRMGSGRELVARRADGSELSVDISLGVVDVAGEQLVSAALRDITDQMADQRTLAASAYIVDHSHDAIYSLDAEGVVITWNHAAERLTGRRAADVVGTAPTGPLGLVEGEDEPLLVERVRRGEQLERHRTRLVRADGMTVPISLSLSAIRDERGRVVGTSGIARDISEEVAAQETLAEVQERLAETQRLARIGLWLYDVRAGELQWSDALYDITGISPFDFGGDLDSFLAIIPEGHRDRVAGEFARVLDQGRSLHLEHPVHHRDGTRLWFMCRGVAETDGRGNVVALQGICQDLTERQRLLEALQEADRLKDRFLSTVSHELRTPLTSIVGFSQLLHDRLEGEERRWLDVIVRNSNEMHGMVERILDFSRLQGGHVGVDLAPHEVTDIVDWVRPLVQSTLLDHELVVDIGAHTVALVDRDAITRVLVNLLTNAARFSAPGTTIRVTAHREGDEVCFRVIDRGAGIASEDLGSIFDRFHKVPGIPLTGTRGVGVGLSIVKGYTEAMGGRLSVSSEVGEGSTFEIRVPAA